MSLRLTSRDARDLRKTYRYHATTGRIIGPQGKPLGLRVVQGVALVRVFLKGLYRQVSAARIAWVLKTGRGTRDAFGVRNGDPSDLRWKNLAHTGETAP